MKMDTPEQIKAFENDPKVYEEYCRRLEGELNKRFSLVSLRICVIQTRVECVAKLSHKNHLRREDQRKSRELVENLMKEQLNHNERLVKHLVPDFSLGCRRMTPVLDTSRA